MTTHRTARTRPLWASLLVLLLLPLLSASAEAQALKIKKGPWTTKSDVPEGWVLYKTKHYQIQSQCGLDKAKRLGKHMEAMNKVYRKMFRPDKLGAKQYAIKLLKDRETFLAYGRAPGAAAYYSATDR